MSEFDSSALPGGVTRVTVRSQTEEVISAPQDTNRVHRGVIREDGSGQLVQNNGQHAPQAGSVLATARGNHGPTARFNAADTTVELVPGNPATRTSIAVALREGVIREVYPGHYEDTNAAPAVAQQGPEESNTSAPELASTAEEADFGQAIADLRQDSYDGAAALAVAAVTENSTEAWVAMAQRLASSEGIEYDAAAEKVEKAWDFFGGQVDRMATAAGIEDPDTFYEWLQQNHPRELQAAVQQLVSTRRLDDFRSLATAYKVEAGQGQLAEWNRLGFDAYVDRDTGDVMVSQGKGRPVRARDLMKG